MTRWWWVRHGPTHQKAFTGWRDVPVDLSDTGKIERLRAALPEGATVVSSDLIRAIETANAIAPDGARLPHEPALREINFGIWDGMHFRDIAKRDPDLSRAFGKHPERLPPPMAKAGTPSRRAAPVSLTGSTRINPSPILSLWHILA